MPSANERGLELLHEVFRDPRAPNGNLQGCGYTVQIHSTLPDPVPIGHFDMDQTGPIVDEMISRGEYLDRIQQACAEHGEACTVRFYDHLDGFDASVLDALDRIRSLTIETVCPVSNVEAVGRLPRLTRLSFAPRGKMGPNLLERVGVRRLEHLTLSETAAPPLDLTPLGEARSLRTLRLLSQGRNVEAIGNCASLTELSLQPTEKFSLAFVNLLPRLEVLKLSVGKKRSIVEIESAPSLRDLSFHWVHKLEDLGDLQRFPTLRRLQISLQKQLKTLRVGARNVGLEHIKADGLDEIIGLTALPALKSLFVFKGGLEVDPSEMPPTLTHFALMPGGLKAREKHEAEVRARGLIPEIHPDASFFYN